MKKKQKGAIICLVGIDGAGKTAQALELCRELSSNGISCAVTRPRYALLRFLPSSLREWIDEHNYITPRNITLGGKEGKSSNVQYTTIFRIVLTFSFLVYALATYLLSIKISSNKLVVCDRYFYDWFYNLWGGASMALARLLPKPDLVFLLDLPVTVAFSRLRFEEDKKISPLYYDSLRNWYLALAKQERFSVVHTDGDFEKTKNLILNGISNVLLGSGN